MSSTTVRTIAVTASVEPGQSLWLNGILQNALFLVRLLQAASPQYRVFLANTSAIVNRQPYPWPDGYVEMRHISDVIGSVDILIILGAQVSAEMAAQVRQRGGKVVAYCCSVEYVLSMQASLFRRPIRDTVYVNRQVDAVWVIPQVAATSRYYYEVLYRRPATVVPFVWDPTLLETACEALPGHGIYRGAAGPIRLACMEPNIGVSKYCLYPVMIAEMVHREDPTRIRMMRVTNTQALRTDPEFVGLMAQIDLVRDGKCTFEDRFDTAPFLASHADVVISHQWDNPLNYFYLEVAWLGYPLVHNARLCHDLGFYYPRSNTDRGKRALYEAMAMAEVGERIEAFRSDQRRKISQYCVGSQPLRLAYYRLVEQLCGAQP